MLQNLLIASVAFLTVVTGVGCHSNDYSDEIARIKSGKLKTAHASWWNPAKENATKALQAAINSGAKQVIVDNIGHDWIVEPLFLIDNQEIIFEKGVNVTALRGAFKGVNDCLFTASGKKNIKLRGNGNVMLKMYKQDYLDPANYKEAEWRHTLSLLGCESIEISNLTFRSSGGDGIYIGTRGMKHCKNITIENVICDDHNRQGCSVISAENLFIRKCVFKNTKGHNPMAGIDFEPNNPSERFVNCIVEDCEFINNVYGIVMYLVQMDSSSKPVSISINNCKCQGNKTGIKVQTQTIENPKNPSVHGSVKFTNCDIENALCPLILTNQQAGTLKINFKNCVMDATSSNNYRKNPITFISDIGKNIGGVNFDNVTVIDNVDREPLIFKNWGTGGITDVSGKINIKRNESTQELDMTDFLTSFNTKRTLHRCDTPAKLDTEKLKPMPEFLKNTSAKQPRTFALRQKTIFLLYAEKGQEIVSSLIFSPLNRPTASSANVKIKAPSEAMVKEFEQPVDDKEHVFKFKAMETGVYILDADPGKNLLTVKNINSGWGISAEKELHLFRPKTRLYFQVPAGVKDFRIELYGDLAETVTAALLNQNLQVVKKQTGIETPYSFEITRPDFSRPEIWAIEFSEAIDDVFVRFYSPLNPVVSNSRNNLLVTEESTAVKNR